MLDAAPSQLLWEITNCGAIETGMEAVSEILKVEVKCP